MNAAADSSWPQAEQVESMAQLSAVDLNELGNLFEFGDIDLDNIQNVDTTSFNDHVQVTQPPSHPTTPFQELSASMSLSGTVAHDFGSQMPFGVHSLDHNPQHSPYLSHDNNSSQFSADIYQNAIRQPFQSTSHPHQFSYQAQPSYPSGHHVPPTPTSFEMHGMQPMDPQQRAILEQRYHLRKDDATAFTPMVSPAGTPQFSVPPDFTVPGAYFSPLTSPMLHAQQAGLQHIQGYYTTASTTASSNATSPADHNGDIDMTGDEIILPDASTQKKTRRRATPRTLTSLRPEQSPMQKAQKRKSSALSSRAPTSNADAVVNEGSNSGRLAPTAGPRSQLSLHGSSEDGSISPEPLSEALMGPPPRPGSSVSQSPSIVAGTPTGANDLAGAAATPKSILSMKGMQPPGSTASVGAHAMAGLALEDLELPAAANPGKAKPSLAQLDTQLSAGSEDTTPRLAARKTPKFGPSSTPASARPTSARPVSASNSPVVNGSSTPGSTPAAFLKDRRDVKGGRPKKRGSLSVSGSGLVSPALRPRISPVIKPLLPEGTTLHSPTHALLLASKSNYQNLLEGNHLPGVNYPDSLSTGLTSKRTSHKVAEQGRRNRINEALKEMQSLLPKSPGSKGNKETAGTDSSPAAEEDADGDGKDGKGDAAKSNSSKAATVESANEYIRRLQKENAELQKEFAEMRRRLETVNERSSAEPEDTTSHVSKETTPAVA